MTNFYNMKMELGPIYTISPEQRNEINKLFKNLLKYMDEKTLCEKHLYSSSEIGKNEHILLMYLYFNRDIEYTKPIRCKEFRDNAYKYYEENKDKYIDFDNTWKIKIATKEYSKVNYKDLGTIKEGTIYNYVCRIKKYLKALEYTYFNNYNLN